MTKDAHGNPIDQMRLVLANQKVIMHALRYLLITHKGYAHSQTVDEQIARTHEELKRLADEERIKRLTEEDAQRLFGEVPL